ncbi:phenylalanine--tRNA ligase subunit alpha [Pseudokineococcus lusitanus]|uniref:Phenylalanine--tRNA ligase alpha subunit n=1 Tax=Pseudokineococcus lusitanus TaxID=763993 RepID=A0A3N1HKJ3_9ACTN|nr:phenylalanine--tRNA ligase subunit alpha [Pseudokineococcus lusitanus]ROP43047.1 phenylalanyl-tRNA synthetase alpha subunit [Pseudokineococcus lusitanus]
MPDPTETPEPAEDATAVDPRDAAAVGAAEEAALAALAAAPDLDALTAVVRAHTGERSPLSLANRAIGSLPGPEKAAAGKSVGQARRRVSAAAAERREALEAERDAAVLVTEAQDLTQPTARLPRGARHPLSGLVDRVEDFFTGLGWDVLEGPEVEAGWFNFDALNFGPDHPARQMQDTFFVEPAEAGLVLRTHTSPVQARALLDHGAPLYVAVPGRVFRTDELDATHTPVFTQVEGLAVDEHLTMAHLRGTLDALAVALLGEGTTTRLRPAFFPFTEPSAELDVRCPQCEGTGRTAPGSAAAVGAATAAEDASSTRTDEVPCRTCGATGWIEWGGCGMVNPHVLRAAGVDPERFSGFAFGMGIERTLMFRNLVGDMRDMVEGDVRFSRQLGGDL